MIDHAQEPVKRATAHFLTTAAFLAAVVGQGFRPCPHHASLDGFGHGAVAHDYSSTGPLHHGIASSASESADEDPCLCVDGCNLGSESHLPSDPTWSSIRIPSPRPLASDWQGRTDLPAPNVHLIPLAQPPPHGFGHLI